MHGLYLAVGFFCTLEYLQKAILSIVEIKKTRRARRVGGTVLSPPYSGFQVRQTCVGSRDGMPLVKGVFGPRSERIYSLAPQSTSTTPHSPNPADTVSATSVIAMYPSTDAQPAAPIFMPFSLFVKILVHRAVLGYIP